jgi:hypothetical protein
MKPQPFIPAKGGGMRKLNFVTGPILILISFSGFASFHSQQPNNSWNNEVATPVEEGVLTDKQKAHSKLYEAYERRIKIRDELIKRQGELVLNRISCPFLSMEPQPDLITELAQSSDAVLTGTVVSKSSQITTGGTYVFTDYELRVAEVFKDAATHTLRPDTTITVTRPGGKVLLFGQVAHFRDNWFKPLLPGRRYVLFLTYLPSTGAYQAVNADGTFDITETRVESLSDGTVRPFERELTPFITKVRLLTH